MDCCLELIEAFASSRHKDSSWSVKMALIGRKDCKMLTALVESLIVEDD